MFNSSSFPKYQSHHIYIERDRKKVIISAIYTMKAKPAIFILLCLFTFYLISSSSILVTGRRSLEMSLPHRKNIHPKAKVVVDDSSWDGSNQHHMDNDNDDDYEIINYHLDYHGVTTHPNPSPKHPTKP